MYVHKPSIIAILEPRISGDNNGWGVLVARQERLDPSRSRGIQQRYLGLWNSDDINLKVVHVHL